MKEEQALLTRSFGGKTEGFIDKLDEFGNIIQTWKQERNIEQKHLKAYLKGKTRFIVGYDKGYPMYVPVKEVWTKTETND